MQPESEDRRGDKEREVILLGILNIDNVYGKDWITKKKEVKKDLQNKSIKLNHTFKNPSAFQERFEFLTLEDYNAVKNNYIYSAIVIFNPNLGLNSSAGEDAGQDARADAPVGQAKVKNTCVVSGGENAPRVANTARDVNNANNAPAGEYSNGGASSLRGATTPTKKKEGVGVLVVTCKKTNNDKMKHILIKMLKEEIKVECTVLKCRDGHFSSLSHVRREEREVKGKHTEIRHLGRPVPSSPDVPHSRVQSIAPSEAASIVTPPSDATNKPFDVSNKPFDATTKPFDATNKPFDVSRNNFFNMTAYIYGSSNLLANTSLILREYGDDEWAERLRRTKKGKEQKLGGCPPGAQDTSTSRESGLIKTFTSLFKK
ncbi:hypothetical protein AK88_03290 [Plasmodium fragile]|uniref:Uncharacterized protein n=1 Tax=Plasmodium fragile TaxID=5857 RepID=A0A0D9QJ63_PLAFR|nr:uncharacterized protein AK88_03290 [Plasmodium fragile]KJP87008.1 hypothetical protein AK88_03290 [Plasmodium fragile]